MTKFHGFRRSGKCCGCVATVHVLIRGDLLHFAFRKKGAATVKVSVMEQKSAEAIVDRTPPLMAVWWLETSRGRTPEVLPCRRAELEEGDVILHELPCHIIPVRVSGWGAS
jgi:hypothetical protein